MKKKITINTETLLQSTENSGNENDLRWEQNHAQISQAITNHLFEHGSMPAKALIADATGLSRETVYKHMRTLAQHTALHNPADSFNLMAEQVMAQVLKAAMQGDLGAAKTFLNLTKSFMQPALENTPKQNNYIQINKTIINQQVIQQLKPDQLQRIEDTIARELHETEGVDRG